MGASYKDLSGWPIGNGRVIGLHEHQGSFEKSRWVMQCECGRFEIKSVKALKRLRQAEIKHIGDPAYALPTCHACVIERGTKKQGLNFCNLQTVG